MFSPSITLLPFPKLVHHGHHIVSLHKQNGLMLLKNRWVITGASSPYNLVRRINYWATWHNLGRFLMGSCQRVWELIILKDHWNYTVHGDLPVSPRGVVFLWFDTVSSHIHLCNSPPHSLHPSVHTQSKAMLRGALLFLPLLTVQPTASFRLSRCLAPFFPVGLCFLKTLHLHAVMAPGSSYEVLPSF